MNQIVTLPVHRFTMGRATLGRAAGAVIRPMLAAHIESKTGDRPVRVSLQGIKNIDAGFAAEAIVALFSHYRGKRPLFLADVTDLDTLENVTAAAERAGEPVTLRSAAGVQVIGLAPTHGTSAALAFALARPQVRAADYGKEAGISAQNASNKFRQLWRQGFLTRSEGKAASGGDEYIYAPIG